MKSERRHELEQNALAKWLATRSEQIKPFLNYLAIATVGLIIIWAGYAVWTRDSRQVREDAAKQLVVASFSADLRETQKAVDVAGDSPAGLLARQRLARQQLVRGNELWMTNRDEAKRNLEDAIKDFERVASLSKDPLTKQYAAYHIALAYESLTTIDKAKKDYEQIVKDWPDSAYGKKAKERLEALNRPWTDDFYRWYREAKFEAASKAFGEPKPSDVKNDGKSPDPLPLPEAPSSPTDGSKAGDALKPGEASKPAEPNKGSSPELKPPGTSDKPAEPAKGADPAKSGEKPAPKS